MFPDPMVNSFVMPAEDDQVFLHGERVRLLLIEGDTVRGGVYDFIIVALALQKVDGRFNRLDGHDHSCPLAESVVVDPPVLVRTEVPEAVNHNLHQVFVFCPFYDGMTEWSLQYFRQNGDDVYAHNNSLCCKNRKNQVRSFVYFFDRKKVKAHPACPGPFWIGSLRIKYE